jgi:hypothetical protein
MSKILYFTCAQSLMGYIISLTGTLMEFEKKMKQKSFVYNLCLMVKYKFQMW